MAIFTRLRGLFRLRGRADAAATAPDIQPARHGTPAQQGPVQVDVDAVQEILDYRFKDTSLLVLSLTHRSFTRFDPYHAPSNERLEFLGDSVLGLVISEQLFRDSPNSHEGELTKTKARLVNEATLASMAQRIGLHKHLRLSPEEDRSGGRKRPSIVSDGFESVIAAIYIDGGFEAARKVVLDHIYVHKDEIMADRSQRNYKGELLELIQGWGETMPRYEVISETGPDHRKLFRVGVTVLREQLGVGEGASKKEAEQQAAALAIQKLKEMGRI
jgi:ribonuclease-3